MSVSCPSESAQHQLDTVAENYIRGLNEGLDADAMHRIFQKMKVATRKAEQASSAQPKNPDSDSDSDSGEDVSLTARAAAVQDHKKRRIKTIVELDQVIGTGASADTAIVVAADRNSATDADAETLADAFVKAYSGPALKAECARRFLRPVNNNKGPMAKSLAAWCLENEIKSTKDYTPLTAEESVALAGVSNPGAKIKRKSEGFEREVEELKAKLAKSESTVREKDTELNKTQGQISRLKQDAIISRMQLVYTQEELLQRVARLDTLAEELMPPDLYKVWEARVPCAVHNVTAVEVVGDAERSAQSAQPAEDQDEATDI